MQNGAKILKALCAFKKEVAEKYNDMKAVNYKTIVAFCKSLNTACGKEVIKVNIHKETLHDYKTHNRVRYEDSYKEGVRMEFECAIFGTRYTGHSKETGNSYALTHWFYTQILEKRLELVKSIGTL